MGYAVQTLSFGVLYLFVVIWGSGEPLPWQVASAAGFPSPTSLSR